MYLRARDYSPGTGRFTSRDTVRPNGPATQGYNAYDYTANNPTTRIDPTGHNPEFAADLMGAAYVYNAYKTITRKLRDTSSMINQLPPLARGLVAAILGFVVGILRTLLTTLVFKAIIDGIPLVSQTILGRSLTLPNMARLFQPFKPVIEACSKKFSLCKSLPKLLPKLPCVIGVISAGAATYGFVAGSQFSWETAGATAIDIADTIQDCKSGGFGGGDPDGPNVCNSFSPGTRVLLADGASKPIAEIRVGDQVLATDPATGETTPRGVTDLITGKGEKHLVALTLATDAGTRTLVATAGHPFWDVLRATWVDACDLRPGDLLQEADGSFVRVLRIDLTMTTTTAPTLINDIEGPARNAYGV